MMAEEGCKVAYLKRKRRYNSYKGEISDAPPNLVGRDFHADAPNKLWLTDITEFKLPVSVNIFFTISTNIFSPIAPSLFRRSRQRGCAASG